MEKLKAAVIGLGRMGAEPSSRFEGKIPNGWLPVSHVEAIKSINNLELISISDVNKERLEKMSRLYNITNLFTDYKEIIDADEIDFLSIATRTEGRCDIIRYAAQKGVKIIYLEKPISRGISECKSTLQIAKENGVFLGYGVNRRYHHAYRKAKEIIKSGELGELIEINVEAGRANLFWSHPHSADLILFFSESTDIDFIQGTCSFQNDYKPKNDLFIDDDPIIENTFIAFKNGIKGTINLTGGLNVRLACSKGILTIYGDGSYIELKKGNIYYTLHEVIKNEEIMESATVFAFRNLIDSYLYNTPPLIEYKEIETGMYILIGTLYSSLSKGRRVEISEIPENLTVTGRSGNLFA